MPSALGGPLERQQAKEEKWKSRLSRNQTSWWDSAALAITERAAKADIAMVAAAAAAKRGNAEVHSARTMAEDQRVLARGRNHARAEIARVEKWRDDAFAGFLGEKRPEPPTLGYAEQMPSEEKSFSPGHFDRLYGGGKKRALPPVRSRVSHSADAAGASGGKNLREMVNRSNRARVFMG